MSKAAPRQTARSELAEALRRCRSAFVGIGLFSCLINILMLTAPLFMLQVYDRVLPSRSVPTLIGLAILAAAMFAFQGILDAIRGRVLLRIGSSINADLSGRVYDLIVRLPLKMQSAGDGLQPMRDLDQIRSFMSGAGPAALFDLPWMPLYVGVCFLFHPLIGIAALCGAVILIVLTLLAEFATRAPARAAVGFAAARNALLDASRRNAEVLHAMGMGPQLSARFDAVNGDYLDSQRCGADRACVLERGVPRHAARAAIVGARAWRLSRHQSRGDRRRDHCELDPGLAGAGSGRARHCQLERLRRRAPGPQAPERALADAARAQAAASLAEAGRVAGRRIGRAPARPAIRGSCCRM